jgi:hypothetical protein
MSKFFFKYSFLLSFLVLSCFMNFAYLFNKSKHLNETTPEIKQERFLIKKLSVADTNFFQVMNDFLYLAEEKIQRFEKNKKSLFFNFATNMQSHGILYRVSMKGFNFDYEYNYNDYYFGALYYKNVLFIIGKIQTKDKVPFILTNEFIDLSDIPKGKITIYDMGDIYYKENSYTCKLDFHKYYPKIN